MAPCKPEDDVTMEMECPVCKTISKPRSVGGGFHYSKWRCSACGGWFDFDPNHEVKQGEEITVIIHEGRGDAKKFDHNKLMWDILPYDQIEKIVEVMTYGAGKYGAESWKTVDSPRYEAAFMRHYVERKKGEAVDKDSKISHLAHAACNLLFMMWLEEHGKKEGE